MNKPIPQYVDEITDSAVERLKTFYATRSEPMHSFAFFTDTHNCSDYTQRTLHSICDINKECDISFVCLGGDYLCNNSSTPKDEAIRQLCELGDILENYPQKPPTMVIKGNHDENPFGKAENMVPHEDVYNILMKPNKHSIVTNENDEMGMYGYYDMPGTKIRAIFVDMMDKDVPREGIGNTQLNWIVHTALNVPDQDWAVIFFAHFEPISDRITPETYLGGSTLWEIIRAFKDGGSFSEKIQKGDYHIDVSCDFKEKGNVIAYICGHHHCSYAFKVDGINIVTLLSACSDNFGIVADPTGKIIRKTRGSAEESSFAIFTIDETERFVSCIYCGAGDDFSFRY